MSCQGLGFCRWLCCVFIVFVNVLSIIIGALLAILGAILLWGYTVLQSATASVVAEVSKGFKESFGADFDFQSFFSNVANVTGAMAGVLIAFGIVLIVVSCVGCFGACCGNAACLIIYMVCVSLLMIGQLIVIIIWFADSNVMKSSVRNTLQKQVTDYRGEKSTNFDSLSLNLVQILVGCCGVANGSDFKESKNWDRNYTMTTSSNDTYSVVLTYPVTCCKFDMTSFKLKDEYCPYNGTADSHNYGVGCYDKIFREVDKYYKLDNFFYALAGLLGLEILLIVGALLVYCAKRQEREDKEDAQYKMHPMA